MKDQLLTQITPLLVTFIIGFVSIIIKSVGDAIVKLIEAKKEEVIRKIGSDKYNSEKIIALDIWNIVEEHFRINNITEDAMNEKINMFNKELQKKVPYLKDEDITFLRQSIAGEINKVKKSFE